MNSTKERETLQNALTLLDSLRNEAADALLTTALVEQGKNANLWMAAGIARLRRGSMHGAKSAFEMCAWLCDDPVAREMVVALSD